MAPADNIWIKALERCSSEGLRVLPLESSAINVVQQILTEHSCPKAVLVFAELWKDKAMSPWEVILQAAAEVSPSRKATASLTASLYPLQKLVLTSEKAAIVWGSSRTFLAPVSWTYLLQVCEEDNGGRRGHLRLQLPAALADISAAEAVIGIRLPPSYVALLTLTNGLGLDAIGDVDVAGAGPQRADWSAVGSGKWWECGQYHEITSWWLEFQATYDYERERDKELGIDSFLSDPHALVPFMITRGGDAWCFNCQQLRSDGEFPVVHWDHELRETSQPYQDFAAWLRQRLSSEVFGSVNR